MDFLPSLDRLTRALHEQYFAESLADLDSLRVSLRSFKLDSTANESLHSLYSAFVHTFRHQYEAGVEVVTMVLRCLNNAVFENEFAALAFLHQPHAVQSMAGLVHNDTLHTTMEKNRFNMIHLAVKVLYMMVSLSEETTKQLKEKGNLTLLLSCAHRLYDCVVGNNEEINLQFGHAAQFPYTHDNAALFVLLAKLLFALDIFSITVDEQTDLKLDVAYLVDDLAASEETGASLPIFPFLILLLFKVVTCCEMTQDSLVDEVDRVNCIDAAIQLLMAASQERGFRSACTLIMSRLPQVGAKVLQPLCKGLTQVLERQVDRLNSTDPDDRASLLTPVVILLTELVQVDEQVLLLVQQEVFETIDVSADLASCASLPMDPTDAPLGTLRKKLYKLMISFDSLIKRCVSELLFALCHNNAKEFTYRTGFGNAIYLLKNKGLM